MQACLPCKVGMGNMSPACMLASLCAQQWNMSVITYHCIDTPLEAACLTGVHCNVACIEYDTQCPRAKCSGFALQLLVSQH